MQLQVIHQSVQDAGGSNCKTEICSIKTSKALWRKALQLHLFCKHPTTKKGTLKLLISESLFLVQCLL